MSSRSSLSLKISTTFSLASQTQRASPILIFHAMPTSIQAPSSSTRTAYYQFRYRRHYIFIPTVQIIKTHITQIHGYSNHEIQEITEEFAILFASRNLFHRILQLALLRIRNSDLRRRHSTFKSKRHCRVFGNIQFWRIKYRTAFAYKTTNLITWNYPRLH